MDEAKKPVDRRSFLDWCIAGGMTAWTIGVAAPTVVYLWPARAGGTGSARASAGKADDWAEGAGRMVQLHGRPVLVLRRPGGEFRAFSAICTHLGCVVRWNSGSKKIECPCHAAAFDDAGRVVSGPPPAPLPPVEVFVRDGEVWVQG